MIYNKEKSYTEEDLLLFIYELRKQNTELKDNWNKLKDRINNAIEYIKELDDETDDTIYDISKDIKIALVDLLKGDKE